MNEAFSTMCDEEETGSGHFIDDLRDTAGYADQNLIDLGTESVLFSLRLKDDME